MSVVIKTVRVRGRISTEGDYWKNPAPNSLGMGDLVLTLEKSGRKDYNVIIRTIHVKKNSEGEYLQQPNTVYSTIGNPGSESFGGYPSIYGSSFDIEPKPSDDVYKTTDDFITKFISNRNLPANLKQNYGRPSSGDSFRSYYAGLTQAPPFYEIIQDPFDPTSVPVHPEGYFDIWNQWVLEINTPVFRSELPTSQIGVTPSQIGGTPSQIGGTPSTTGLSQSILLNVVFPSEFGVKVREDVPKFKIWVGDPQPEEQVDGFIFEGDNAQVDENGNIVTLGDEYIESEFAGDEELKATFDAYIEQISQDKNSNITPEEKTEIAKEMVKYKPGKPSKTPPADIIKAMKDYGITSALERAHFLAQCAHESGQFAWKREFASGKAYEGRESLGNTQKGDGVRYKGRGYIQITGRANYTEYNKYLKSKGINDDVVANPELLEGKFAADCSVWFWKIAGPKGVKNFPKKANEGAGMDIVTKISIWINGGENGLADRKEKFTYYWSVLEKSPSSYT